MQKQKKTKPIFLCILLSLSLLFGCSGCSLKSAGTSDHTTKDPSEKTEDAPDSLSFEEFIDNVYKDEVSADTMTLHYTLVHPEKYNISMENVTLGTISQKEITDSIKELEELKTQLTQYSYDSLSEENKLIYDILDFTLSYLIPLNSYEYYAEPLGPTTGLQAQLPVLFAEYSFYTKEDILTYIELLQCVPDYFDDLIQYEKEKSEAGLFMTDSVADEIISQCEKFIEDPNNNLLLENFDHKIEDFPGLSTDETVILKEQNREAVINCVIPSYQKLIAAIKELKGTGQTDGGLASYPDGKTFFELYLQSQVGTCRPVTEIRQMLENTLNSSLLRMSKAQQKDPTLLEQYASPSYPSGTPADNLEQLRTACEEDFPVLKEVDYSVQYLHESLQEYLSPAMYLIPPVDDMNNNRILINPNPIYDEAGLYTTLAHEGYPGHLYQNVYFLSTNPHPLRHLLRTQGYSEGWGTYGELYGYRLAGLDDALAQFLTDNQVAILCLYGLSEIGIHYEGWSKADTVRFWGTYGIDKTSAESIYLALIAEPVSYLPYCVGYLEFMELYDSAEKALGSSFHPTDFHEFILSVGPAPFPVIQSRLDDWLAGKK